MLTVDVDLSLLRRLAQGRDGDIETDVEREGGGGAS